jgi:hypothetical protein
VAFVYAGASPNREMIGFLLHYMLNSAKGQSLAQKHEKKYCKPHAIPEIS